jgi:hypothetical protein
MPPIIDWQFLLRVPPGHVTAAAGGSVWAIDVPTWITAIATVGLLTGAIVTAIYAIRAFRAQAKEISDQADLLGIQSSRLELQERQFEDQRKINQKRDELLDKQIKESEQWARTFERRQAEMIDLEPGSIGMTVPGLDPGEDSQAWRADVANGSPRPIRNIAGRIEAGPGSTPQQAALADVYADFPPSALAHPAAGRRTLIKPPERPAVPLIRAGDMGALVFPVGARKNPDARITVRFTDDAGLHWQIDHDLHLEKLDNRDW